MLRVRMSLGSRDLSRYVARQLDNMFPDGTPCRDADLEAAAPAALERLEHCFTKIDSKYFSDDTGAVFNHLHGDQYAMWLYLLGNQLHRSGADRQLCDKLFLLNKALHGCDLFYEVELPSIFLLVHPLGTVLGRGAYSDYFVAYQRCGVGSNRDIYPNLGRHLTLRPGSAVLGNSQVGDHCQIAAESLVIDRDLPDGSLYFGDPKTATVMLRPSTYPLWRNE